MGETHAAPRLAWHRVWIQRLEQSRSAIASVVAAKEARAAAAMAECAVARQRLESLERLKEKARRTWDDLRAGARTARTGRRGDHAVPGHGSRDRDEEHTVSTTDGIGAGTAAGDKSTGSDAIASRVSGMGREAFLQLLVTQLAHQNPLQPQADGEFVAQLAQFSSLEQLTTMNTTLARMAKAMGVAPDDTE